MESILSTWMSSMPRSPYTKEMLSTLAVYCLALVGSIELLQHTAFAPAWQAAIALTPMLACFAAAWVILREIRRMDELQRRIQFEALGFAFAATALGTFSYGFLEGLGWPRLSMFGVWPLMAVLWVVGLVIARRRYR
jgi:hypothetical protein